MLYNHFLKTYIQARNTERGATMVEYGVMVALIAAIAIVAVAALGVKVNAAFELVEGKMPN